MVDRYPRDKFTIATKFPTFAVQTENQVEGIFAGQLQNLGTDYVDYYLLHILKELESSMSMKEDGRLDSFRKPRVRMNTIVDEVIKETEISLENLRVRTRKKTQ